MLPQRVVFLHPDLGIGGAERLVIDAAVGLQKNGHKVTIYTSHCDPSHCFDEARDGKFAIPPLCAGPKGFLHALAFMGFMTAKTLVSQEHSM